MAGTDQFGRKISLVVLPATGDKGLDLSEMHIQFGVSSADNETPTTARIRVFNLSPDTVKKIQNEFAGVILQAGYENGNFGTIFKGDLKMIGRGKSTNVDSYLDLFAADEDWYIWASVNTTLEKGASNQQLVDILTTSADGQNKVNLGFAPTLNLNEAMANLRGKVLFGMNRQYIRYVALNNKSDFSVQNNTLQFVPKDGYRDDEVVKLNSLTGMIGQPEQTNEGINITCLLNSNIVVGQRVQINNQDINQAVVRQQGFPKPADLIYLAPVDPSADGIYRVFAVEHNGDTRDNPWYTRLYCLNVDATSGKVRVYGG